MPTLKQGESQKIVIDFSASGVDFMAAGVDKVFARVSTIGNPSLFVEYNTLQDTLPELTIDSATELGIPFEREHSAKLHAGELIISVAIHYTDTELVGDRVEYLDDVAFATLELADIKDADTCA